MSNNRIVSYTLFIDDQSMNNTIRTDDGQIIENEINIEYGSVIRIPDMLKSENLEELIIINNDESMQLILDTNTISNMSRLKIVHISRVHLYGNIRRLATKNLVRLSLEEVRADDSLEDLLDELSIISTNLTTINITEYQDMNYIPNSINNLSALEELIIVDSNLIGPIPNMNRLLNLSVLDLSYNQLSGPIPSTIGSLISLNRLDLSNNILTGSIPDSIRYLNNLRNLNLSNNELSGQFPNSSIDDMSNLTIIDIHNNPNLEGEINIDPKSTTVYVYSGNTNTFITQEYDEYLSTLDRDSMIYIQDNLLEI